MYLERTVTLRYFCTKHGEDLIGDKAINYWHCPQEGCTVKVAPYARIDQDHSLVDTREV